MRVLKWSAIAAFGLSVVAQAAGATTPAENRYAGYAARPLPACASGEVLSEVAGWFASREAFYWGTGLSINAFDKIRETGLRPWGASYVPRRFCSARVHMSDGRLRHVNYFVRESIGHFGNTWEVIWCVTGLDRHRTYAPNCEQATAW
ncbi:MAG: hypothetical protein NT037_13460 [Hyphomicrobiales bacterium]|jgi:hypothetical protein|nr:hypothetical protein [Hyphomicrobiales bacterium]